MMDFLLLPEPALIGAVAALAFLAGMIVMAVGMFVQLTQEPRKWARALMQYAEENHL